METKTWKMLCEKERVYNQRDPKMPLTLAPFEHRPLVNFADDPPLSEAGQKMAEMMGACLLREGCNPDFIYASPALRCVQTAEFLSRCFESPSRPKIRVETGLYGTSFSHIEEPREWLRVKEFANAGYFVDCEYEPMMTQRQIG